MRFVHASTGGRTTSAATWTACDVALAALLVLRKVLGAVIRKGIVLRRVVGHLPGRRLSLQVRRGTVLMDKEFGLLHWLLLLML